MGPLFLNFFFFGGPLYVAGVSVFHVQKSFSSHFDVIWGVQVCLGPNV